MKYGKVIVGLALAAAVGIGAMVWPRVEAQATAAGGGNPVRTISVSGTAFVEVKPDVAYITVGFMAEDKDAKKAQSDCSSAMEKITKAMRDGGAKDEDIQTMEFNLSPSYDYSGKTPVLTGYQMTQTIRVRINDMSKVGTMLDAAFTAGANISRGVEFNIKDSETAQNQAMEKAFANAKRRAETLAKTAGVSLGNVVSISEGGASYTPVYREYALSASADMAKGSSVEGGSLNISANLSVTFEMK